MPRSHFSKLLERPRVMGVLNITPDSFYDGGRLFTGGKPNLDACLQKAESMVAQGATFIDVGGESTRPGASRVSRQEELDRIIPVVEAIHKNIDVIISVDTSDAHVITHSASCGAGLINDVRALQSEGALHAAVATNLPVCLMHMLGQPGSMQNAPRYDDVVVEVSQFLEQRVKCCLDAGMLASRILLDPGIGFGKTDVHNVSLLKKMSALVGGEYPILVGVSRKSMIGRLLNRELPQRLAGSLAFAYAALVNGAKILRVHDVQETVDVVSVFELMNNDKEI